MKKLIRIKLALKVLFLIIVITSINIKNSNAGIFDLIKEKSGQYSNQLLVKLYQLCGSPLQANPDILGSGLQELQLADRLQSNFTSIERSFVPAKDIPSSNLKKVLETIKTSKPKLSKLQEFLRLGGKKAQTATPAVTPEVKTQPFSRTYWYNPLHWFGYGKTETRTIPTPKSITGIMTFPAQDKIAQTGIQTEVELDLATNLIKLKKDIVEHIEQNAKEIQDEELAKKLIANLEEFKKSTTDQTKLLEGNPNLREIIKDISAKGTRFGLGEQTKYHLKTLIKEHKGATVIVVLLVTVGGVYTICKITPKIYRGVKWFVKKLPTVLWYLLPTFATRCLSRSPRAHAAAAAAHAAGGAAAAHGGVGGGAHVAIHIGGAAPVAAVPAAAVAGGAPAGAGR